MNSEEKYTPHDVVEIVKRLQRYGIIPLIWGEMGAIAAYHSRLIPFRLVIIVTDSSWQESLRVVEKELRLEPSVGQDGFGHVYRMKPTDHCERHLRILKASEFGLKYNVWERAVVGKLLKGSILVPNPSDFLCIATRWIQAACRNKSEKLGWIIDECTYVFYQCWLCSKETMDWTRYKVEDSDVELAWVLCKLLPHDLYPLKSRLSFPSDFKRWKVQKRILLSTWVDMV